MDSRWRHSCLHPATLPDPSARAYAGVMMVVETPPQATHQAVHFADGMLLDCGVRLGRLTVAYRTYGRLNAERSNAVLVCHALTGDQYVAEAHPLTGKPGWWRRWWDPAGRWTPTASSSSRPMCSAAAWARPARPARRTSSPRAGGSCPGGPISPPSRSATWSARRSASPSISASTASSPSSAARWAGCRCSNGPRSTPGASSPPCRSPPPPITWRRTSPSTRSGARRSSPTRTGWADAIGNTARCRRAASRWRG